jgi:phosphoribosylformylglycinamidine synthase
MEGLKNLGLTQIRDVRIGRHITLHVNAENEAEAKEIADKACRRLLANPVMEHFEVKIDA